MTNCGYRTGVFQDKARSNWQNNGPRPVAWSAWYPIESGDSGTRATAQFFETGDVIYNAPLKGFNRWPVALLSHGTGGTAESLGWLARSVAKEGYIVIAANHHGNTGLEPYTAEGFLCWWERAADLSFLLSSMDQETFFSGRLDLDQVSAIGFSLGAYTVMAVAGAQTSLEAFEAWRSNNEIAESGPREFPNAADAIPALLKTSQAFATSWARSEDDFSDYRIKKVVAIAPPPPVRAFTASSLAKIKAPLFIITGEGDIEAPSEQCADWLIMQNDWFQRFDLGRHVGHYTFLDFPSDRKLIGQETIFTDHESVDRGLVHKQTADIILKYLS